jgi:hypothetical protein
VRPSCSCRRQCRAPVIEPAWLGLAWLGLAWLSSAGIRAPTPRPRRSLSCENKLRPPVPVGASTRSAVSAGMS